MKIVQISGNKNRGVHFIVDDDDFGEVKKYRWYLSRKGYVKRNIWINKKSVQVTLHRLISRVNEGVQVDHINGDRLDNRKNNLRRCNNSQNQGNTALRSDNTSGFKGVYFRKGIDRWRAYIQYNKRWINIGHYHTKEEAAKAYNRAAIKHYGEFAKLNEV